MSKWTDDILAVPIKLLVMKVEPNFQIGVVIPLIYYSY